MAGKVRLPRQASLPDEAFFHLGEPMPGKIFVVVEDIVGAGDSEASLYLQRGKPSPHCSMCSISRAAHRRCGGTICRYTRQRHETMYWCSSTGISAPHENLQGPRDRIAAADEATSQERRSSECTKVDVQFHVDGGRTGANTRPARGNASRRFVSWALRNTDYLPGSENPEAFVWQNMQKADKRSDHTWICRCQGALREANAHIELGTPAFEAVTSDEIFATQRRCLATIPVDHPDLIFLEDTTAGVRSRATAQNIQKAA
jgi:hypothetical protein